MDRIPTGRSLKAEKNMVNGNLGQENIGHLRET